MAKKRGRPRKKKTTQFKDSNTPTVTCVLCGERHTYITEEHLRAHGYTTSQYRFVFGAALTPNNTDPHANSVPAHHLPMQHTQPEQDTDQTPHPEAKTTHLDPDLVHLDGEIGAPLSHAPVMDVGAAAMGVGGLPPKRLNWMPVPPPGSVDPRMGFDPETASGLPPVLIRQLANHLVRHPEYLARVSTDVSQAMLNGPQRDMLSQGLSTLIMTRISLHSGAIERLNRINAELGQQWRIEQGGENGGPTPTKDLLGMHNAQLAEVKTAEDLLLKAVKIATDEAKNRKADPRDGAPMDRYKGGKDVELMQKAGTLSGSERETVRQLMAMLVEGARAKSQLIEANSIPIQAAKVVDTHTASASEPDDGPIVTPPDNDF